MGKSSLATKEAEVIAATACPRCRGTLTRVQDVGETYHSCVQCGHVVYGVLHEASTADVSGRWQGLAPADRSLVRRRQIVRERQRAARRAAA
jgi:hypothetical protein